MTGPLYSVERWVSATTGMSPGATNLFFSINIGFLLSLMVSLINEPNARKWASTSAGLFMGFYAHGLSYWRTIMSVACIYACFVIFSNDRKKARFSAILVASVIMQWANFQFWWDSYLNVTSSMTSCVWMRTIATMNEYVDAERIEKAK